MSNRMAARSEHRIEIPEVDRGSWFPVTEAQERILGSQRPLLQLLCKICIKRRVGEAANVATSLHILCDGPVFVVT